ncbi:hypothetical protein N7516_003385 [Penicillium verrucosum]|uniref:uncharacterized protein n=1 Tax=Penicillium verrucosum TaxID=60171 RepID=UPI002544ED79|nr:uncharacterized protein N7516_003385 [Penicillium verrucosum]KAJ5943217.1 hypothetical protein N7516_003385 [Penicillium verrucosum]
MSEDVEQRPAKRQRFFTDNPSSPLPTKPRDTDASLPHCPEHEEYRTGHGATLEIPSLSSIPKSCASLENETVQQHTQVRTTESLGLPIADATATASPHENGVDQQIEEEVSISTTTSTPADGFDVDLFTSIVGEQLPADSIKIIQSAASNNLERAVNIYFDGSWKKPVRINGSVPARNRKPALPVHPSAETPVESESVLRNQPSVRYVGAFGVGGWATRSGLGFLKHGDTVNIERARSQPTMKRGRGGKAFVNHKSDVLTRFTNTAGQEIGRLPHETAEWVSTLIDQKICRFEGVCVFVPDRVRVNDTIYLQLRVYLRKEAFQSGSLAALNTDDNRSTGLFEEKESTEEKNLRLRQVGLVKLFHEINLHPTSTNPTTEKHKRDGILRAAEIAEQYDSTKKENKPKSNKDSNDSSGEDDSEELEKDQLDTLYQKAQSFDFNMPAADPAPTFTLNLRKYQQQALHWMLSKEKDSKQTREKSMHPLWEEYTWPRKDVDDKDLPQVKNIDHFYINPYSGDLSVDFPAQEQHCRGGILADEMGLGKTIEMLSLVHSHRVEPDPRVSNGLSSVNDLARMPNSSAVVPAPYTTLVVAPTSLISQWESEALKAGTLRVLVYYGSDKAVNLRELCCESKYATAPQVIVTSYGVVLSEFRQLALQSALGPSANGGLFSVEFFRVILDEAHVIKNRRSKSAKSCYELKAAHRWALTGTPIVNRLEDLFSLVRFLKVEPWSNFSFWKTFITVPFESKEYVRALNVVQSVLEPLVLRRTKSMKTPEGEPLVPLPKKTVTIEEVELSKQEREIYDCIYTRAKRTYNDNVVAGTLLQSYSTIFAQILRLRQTCCHPIMTRNKAIVAEEESAAVAADATNEFKDDMDLQELINQFTTENENASSQDTSGAMVKFTTHALRQIQSESSGECPICCEEPMIDPAVTACWHSACKKCLEDFLQHQMNKGVEARCFNCRAPVDAKNTFEVVRHPSSNSVSFGDDTVSSTPPTNSQPAPRISLRRIHPLSPSAHTSAKIHALINHLGRIPANTKSVVFSQFTSFLDLIGPQLSRVGISHLRLDGSMPQKARAAVLAEFTKAESFTDDDIVDMEDDTLGGAGLQKLALPRPRLQPLQSYSFPFVPAANVFVMDPWWSFAIEAQAIDRVHRMGQTRDVNVTRFVVKDSIEGRMLRVQERKMNIAGSLGLKIGGDDGDADKGKDRMEELKMLFE